MAIAAMTHLRLVGLRSQQKSIVDALTDSGLFEARATDCVSVGLKNGDATQNLELKLKQGRISFALDFLKQRYQAMEKAIEVAKREVKKGIRDSEIDYTLAPGKFSSSRMLITHADFSDVRAKEFDLMGVCDTLSSVSLEMADLRSRMGELVSLAKSYEPYAVCPLKLSELSRGGDVRIMLFYSRAGAPVTDILKELNCAFDCRNSDGLYTVVVRAVNADALEKRMSAAGYEKCPFTDDCTAKSKIDALYAERDDIERSLFALTKKSLDYIKYYDELRILYDVIELEIERAKAEEKFLSSDSAFVLEGWLPEAVANKTAADIKEKFPSTLLQLLAPEERDAPPTLVVNNKFVQPYEDVTNMYMPPKYREIDPNPIMSIFYFLFFGIMVGDAVYGLVLAVIGLVFGMTNKFDRGAKRLLLLIGWGGVSAVIWGIIFGGYVSIDFGSTNVALWFNPLSEPLTLLVLSIVLGCLQLMTGYIMQFIKLCKAGEPISAVCDAGPIILIFCALGLFGLSFVLASPPKGLTYAAIAVAATAVAVMIIFGGRKNKNLFGKIFGGFKGLYGLVNLLSDVLSYCRLFGLCLASGAIGLAFNTLGGILFDIPVIGYPVGVIILIPLHVFNMALGVLSAYVHDARLQFLEFYGKFYEGNGRLFAPLGQRTKHIRFA